MVRIVPVLALLKPAALLESLARFKRESEFALVKARRVDIYLPKRIRRISQEKNQVKTRRSQAALEDNSTNESDRKQIS
jgi:hypothetical protein